MSELRAIKEMMEGISGGYWEWSNFTKADGSKIESVEDICVILSESARKGTGTKLSGVSSKDPDDVVVCYTGNGPKADANARFLASAPDAIRWLVAALTASQERVMVLADFLLSGNRIPFHWKDSPGGYFCAWCEAPWQRGHYPECAMGKAIEAALAPKGESR